MIVICDASALNYLCRIGHIEVMRSLFGKVVLPPAVVAEMSRQSTPESVRSFIASLPNWLEIDAAAQIEPSLAKLGAGEREVISLAIELHADLVIIDDKAARRAAERNGLNVLGTLGVLKLAAERNLVNLATAVRQLCDSGFFMSEELLQSILDPLQQNPPAD